MDVNESIQQHIGQQSLVQSRHHLVVPRLLPRALPLDVLRVRVLPLDVPQALPIDVPRALPLDVPRPLPLVPLEIPRAGTIDVPRLVDQPRDVVDTDGGVPAIQMIRQKHVI